MVRPHGLFSYDVAFAHESIIPDHVHLCYFDTVNHEKLIDAVTERISDGRVRKYKDAVRRATLRNLPINLEMVIQKLNL